MNVSVGLFGNLRLYSSLETPGEWNGDIPEGSSIRDLIRTIGIKNGQVGGATISDRLTDLDAEIPSGARVLLFSWMSGG